MAEWPELEPELRARLALDPDGFEAMIDAFLDTVPSLPADAEWVDRALGYPWERPDGSYVLDADRVVPLGEAAQPGRSAVGEVASRAHELADGPAEVVGALRMAPRQPLLAVGSNGAPSTLVRKFAGLTGNDARILVETGWVADLDIGAVASPTVYGSFPATPIESPGTRVRAALLWPTPAQLAALTWSELSYWVGRLDGHPFTPGDGTPPVGVYLIYVNRWGALRLGDERLALAAFEARARSARPVTQRELLDETAPLWLGTGATGDDLLARLATDHATTRRALAPLLRPLAEPFSPPGWTPLPAR
ncbi:MAG: hypothetical protein J7513_13635 [Solirubrobacteraceae bacterium]|nr:hypothetical protein [Solirubrobacteraceae bacterium]